MSSSNKTHTLEIDSVDLSFGERSILSNVYVRLETGKIIALLGGNGCGKSCLMRILFGDLEATYKSVRIDSKWLKRLTNKQILYLSQSSFIPKGLKLKTVFKDFNLSFDDFCKHFPEFESFQKKRIRELSGGELRIVEIYVILKAKSQFAMLDEPFTQLMPLQVAKIKSLIVDAKWYKGILLTDHMYRNVVDIADSLYVISNQTVYQTKSINDLIKYGYLRYIDDAF